MRRVDAPLAGSAGAKPIDISGENDDVFAAKTSFRVSANAVTPIAVVVRKRRRSISTILLRCVNSLQSRVYHVSGAFRRRSGLAAGNRAFNHLLVDGEDARAAVDR